ncbi:hypothetical protein LZ30DRAFT_743365 [Colletotrichum cereale]|nr:hypothetical protein LZ30DRAFT_743365 [Colletotrichum cereale]
MGILFFPSCTNFAPFLSSFWILTTSRNISLNRIQLHGSKTHPAFHCTVFEAPSRSGFLPVSSLIHFSLGSVAKTTGGAPAPVTLHSEVAYSTARACAANCLVLNGIGQFGVNAGYQYLGLALQCSCRSINGCYCNIAVGSSANSYVSCIGKGRSKVDN